MPELSSADKKAQLARMSYAHFLTQVWHLDAGVLPLFQTRTHGLFGVGIDAVPAQDAWGLGFPGFQGMHLDPVPGLDRTTMPSAIPRRRTTSSIFPTAMPPWHGCWSDA